MFWKKPITPISKFGPRFPDLLWPNSIKTAFYKLLVICGKYKTCTLPQVTNQQRTKTKRFSQRSFYHTKNKAKTHHFTRFKYFYGRLVSSCQARLKPGEA